jgi:hypothetical protein
MLTTHSYNPKTIAIPAGEMMERTDADPELLAELDQQRPGDRMVTATFILHDRFVPKRSWTDATFKQFNRFVEDIVSRIEDKIGTDELRSVRPDPSYGAIEVFGRVSFIEEFIRQPEVSRCLKGGVMYTLPRWADRTIA